MTLKLPLANVYLDLCLVLSVLLGLKRYDSFLLPVKAVWGPGFVCVVLWNRIAQQSTKSLAIFSTQCL
jgi:hypothetical protein